MTLGSLTDILYFTSKKSITNKNRLVSKGKCKLCVGFTYPYSCYKLSYVVYIFKSMILTLYPRFSYIVSRDKVLVHFKLKV